MAQGGAWQEAFVVAFQVRGVSEPTRHAPSAEAKVRGESLQEYLLDLLDREARDIDIRRLLAGLAAERRWMLPGGSSLWSWFAPSESADSPSNSPAPDPAWSDRDRCLPT
jgi:hypothetical protein